MDRKIGGQKKYIDVQKNLQINRKIDNLIERYID